MSIDSSDWESIKKQIKKALQRIDSKKLIPSDHTPSWDEIEKYLQKKHQRKKESLSTKSDEDESLHEDKPKKKETKSTGYQLKSSISLHEKTRSDTQRTLHFLQSKHQPSKRKRFLNNIARYFSFHIFKEKISSFHPKQFATDNIIELILFASGLLMLLIPFFGSVKIGFTLILISGFLFILMIEEKTDSTEDDNTLVSMQPVFSEKQSISSLDSAFQSSRRTVFQQLRSYFSLMFTSLRYSSLKQSFSSLRMKFSLNDRIAIVLISWTLLLFVLTADIEIYFVLIFLGVLITKELTDLYTSTHFKHRLNVFIIVFLSIYIVLIAQKIFTILQT